MSRPSVFFDNVDELRNEYDWMYEFMGRMAERIRGDADVHSLADYVHKIEDENVRLHSCIKDDAENAKAIMGENKALRELFYEAWDWMQRARYDRSIRTNKMDEIGVKAIKLGFPDYELGIEVDR